jgi:hypothetical protein
MAIYKDERGNTVSTAETEKVVEATAVQSRQGLLCRPVLKVLIGGLVLAAVAWAVAGQYGEAIDNDAATTKQQATDTKAIVTPSEQTVIDNTPPAGEKMQPAPTDRDPTAESGTGGGSHSVVPAGTEKIQ